MKIAQSPKKSRMCVVGPRPKTDDGYFEHITKAVFRSGFNWDVIEKKWPALKNAFADFSVAQVATFGARDFERLMKNINVVRNRRKIAFTIENAKRILLIKKEHSSFRNYLASLRRGGEEHMKRAVIKDFEGIGASMVVSLLRSVGEALPESDTELMTRHFKGP